MEYGKTWAEHRKVTLQDWKLIEPKLRGKFTNIDLDIAMKISIYLCDSLEEAEEYCIKNRKPEAFRIIRLAKTELAEINKRVAMMTGTRVKAPRS